MIRFTRHILKKDQLTTEAKLKISITSCNIRQLAQFIGLCKIIEQLGAVGASRTIKLWVDGDGSARLRFDFGETDVSGVEIPSFDENDLDDNWRFSIE